MQRIFDMQIRRAVDIPLVGFRHAFPTSRNKDRQRVAGRPARAVDDLLDNGSKIRRALIRSCLIECVPRGRTPGDRGSRPGSGGDIIRSGSEGRGVVAGFRPEGERSHFRSDFVHGELDRGIDDGRARWNAHPCETDPHCLVARIVHQFEIGAGQADGPRGRFLGIVAARGNGGIQLAERGGTGAECAVPARA